jgi:copper chaperone
MATHIYVVEGMTCGHCVSAVTGEVTKIAGVSQATVDLGAKTVTVTAQALDDAAVRAAVAEAGYTVVG